MFKLGNLNSYNNDVKLLSKGKEGSLSPHATAIFYQLAWRTVGQIE